MTLPCLPRIVRDSLPVHALDPLQPSPTGASPLRTVAFRDMSLTRPGSPLRVAAGGGVTTGGGTSAGGWAATLGGGSAARTVSAAGSLTVVPAKLVARRR